ncbi:hypothetical protein [Streptomyces sp. NPDC059552]|uniref:hypothetical protein n=1 Tax=Streptomyces sp. NPDC059552 TaxID=3346862 RepID=UPI00367EB893
MTSPSPARQVADHVRRVLGDGPFRLPGGWFHMGAVICDASFQARTRYVSTLRPRLLRLQEEWPDAVTVRGFRDRLATHDLAVAMDFRSPGKVAKAHDITDLLVAEGVDTREDLHAWIARPAGRTALRAVKGVGPKSVDYMGNLVGRSQVAVDVHLRAFAADAGVPQLGYGQLRAAYEEAAALLGHEPGALEHAVWRAGAGLDAAWAISFGSCSVEVSRGREEGFDREVEGCRALEGDHVGRRGEPLVPGTGNGSGDGLSV